MAATDYVIVTGWMNAYLTKKKKPTKKGPQTMSEICANGVRSMKERTP